MASPFDLNMPNPELLIQGADAGNGQYTYRFYNASGYLLTITVEGQTFELATNGGEHTVTLDKASVYFDYYGGNVTFTRAIGLVTFSM
jgi:microcystin-dependent protein